jgi:hypothetical protein
LTIFSSVLAAADTQEPGEINLFGLIFFLPFLAFYTAVAIFYLSMVKRPVKVVSIVVFVLCALAGAAVSMIAYAALFAPDGELTSAISVLGFFTTGIIFSLLTGIGGVIVLGKLSPRYGQKTA